MNYLSASRRSAFTLIELLVVIGIIGFLAGGLGLALNGSGNSTTALQSAQSTMSSLLASTRGQAALTGYSAALFVDNTPGPAATPNTRYLRYCVVAVYNTTSSSWVAVNEGIYLAKGIYVVPPNVASLTAPNVTFPASIVASGFDGAVNSVALNSTAQENWLVLGVSSLGSRIDASKTPPSGSPTNAGNYITLSTADPQPPGSSSPILFNNSQNVRGMTISQYGVAGFINDATGFQ